MTYLIVDGRIGAQPIANTSTTQNHPLGTIIRAVDGTYGEGEFIYLLGVASTIVGSVVRWNFTTHQTELAPATAATGSPLAVAMSANVASAYGWYQIKGVAVCTKTAAASITDIDGAAVYIAVTAGALNTSVTSGMQILNAQTANLASVASATVTMTVLINRPCMQSVA